MNAPRTPAIPLLDLDLLKTLVAIAESGSFSAAASIVGRTPSAVSMQVKRMEDLLGRPVFLRDSRTVELTSDGAFLLEHGRRMLALNRDALARFIAPDVEGVVRLGAPDDVAERHLPKMLRAFAESHPLVTTNVCIDGSSRMEAMLQEGKLDMAIISCNSGYSDPRAELLQDEQLVWAMCRGGVAVENDPLPVSVWEEGCAWREAGLNGLREAGREWRIAFQSAHISGQRAAILADLAVAPIPRSSLTTDIVEVPKQAGLPPLPKAGLFLKMAADPSDAVKAAADHLRANLGR